MGADQPNVKAIFCDALDKTTGRERAAYLEQTCGDRPEIRSQVEELLRLHEDAGSFLGSPLLDPETLLDATAVTEGPGTVIGRYKLLEKIGEGGMAVVYMAESATGGPIRRKVALKIIKLGMDTRQVIARFEAERQALALMDHPSIARVLDAGATEGGRPYFVMELVQGVSITEYCDRNRLSTKDRLALFVQVCHAVQHAHQKGIIHRDIKPSNVMVTHHDGKPVPKVIDFGIDTRSDIYSLGVLLYELLTGATPFSEEELRKAGYLEMQRVIREQEPVKPSTRIRTSQVAQSSWRGRPALVLRVEPDAQRPFGPGPPSNRGQDARDTQRSTPYQQVRGDLDWIVMKTLEKDRARRYDTASGLAEDIRRHLESEPVLARGPSATYRLQKFLRRHRVHVLAALALTALALAAVVGLSQWSQGRRRLAEAEGLRHQAEGLRHKETLSQAREQYAKADRNAALETIRAILGSLHVGPEARLLQAGILVDNRRPEEAVKILSGLLGERREIAGAAHALWARILWESESLDAERLQEMDEHRRQAEALLPETAEAYFLRAMTALTVKDQLTALDKALELDPKYYESRRLRAFTYYASRKYGRTIEDASVMQALRDRDPLGYSLRAIALCELGRYQDAMEDYDRAMSLMVKEDAQYLDLATQRLETRQRVGHYGRLVADAQEYLRSWPERPIFRYHLFCALTALGDYDEAGAVFQEIIRSAPTARNEFSVWAAKYVFDALEAGRAWHPADRKPAGPAFLPMIEAQETYRDLSARARLIVTNGFGAQWSPDGTKLAFSMGVHGDSGVAIYDPATKEIELLIVPGRYPRWSPDGRCIAFVRDRQILRLEELASTERRDYWRAVMDEEVWIMQSDGTQPRRLARGGSPSWSQDSARVYYQSRADSTLCSVSIVGPETGPKRIVACSAFLPSVSPDGQRIAYVEDSFLEIKDLASQVLIAAWPVPLGDLGEPAWCPTGGELCMGGSGGLENQTGLWLYRLDHREPVKTLCSQITGASWASDRTKLAFDVGSPYFTIWVAALDPNVSTIESLGSTRTPEEHFQDMVAFYTRRIEADPHDAYAYSNRARYHDSLREHAKVKADMERWSSLISGQSPSDWWSRTRRSFRRVIDLPFDCELVFSAERQMNGIPAMSIAFGQKGRCEMKLFEVPVAVMSLFGFCLLAGLDAPGTYADFKLGEPTNLGPVVNGPAHDGGCISPDGLSIFFDSDRSGGYGSWDIWVTTRDTTDGEWGVPANLGSPVNTSAWDGVPSVSTDGLTLFFSSNRSGGSGEWDLWVTTRQTREHAWVTPVNVGSTVNSSSSDWSPYISADGLELYFVSMRPGGTGGYDLWMTTRPTTKADWSPPVNLGPKINTSADEYVPSLTADGLCLFFCSLRPGGYGSRDIWVTTRATKTDEWRAPVNLGPPLNSPSMDQEVSFSPDGSILFFLSSRPGGYGGLDFWQTPITPIVDFNGDGKVDAADMALLADNWGQNVPLCDIGPFAWGDGVVNEKDLAVLMESLMTPGPEASDVPCDVVLSWVSPSFADSHDVYFGTSLEAVSSATRDDPCGVLVSEGQLETTYDPNGLLEFSQTYYWRVDTVDVVVGSLDPMIYRGPVLSFTTEPFARPIQSITATASSSGAGMSPMKTVDGSGLDENDGHSTDGMDMWQSPTVGPHWIQFEFDKVYTLHELWVWNSNQVIEPFMGFGAKTVRIEYSADGATWTVLDGVPEFARAPGQAVYAANTIVSFGGVSAQYVKLTIEKGWGATPSVGLSEVRFFYIPDRSATQP